MSSSSLHLIYPLFGMFLLSAVVLMVMFKARVRAVKAGQIKAGYFKTYESVNVPEAVIKTARHFSNLFETPVLFYVICTLGMILNVDSQWFLILAWCYIAIRAVHAYVHMGSNKLPIRMSVYTVGWVIMITMWAILLMKVAA